MAQLNQMWTSMRGQNQVKPNCLPGAGEPISISQAAPDRDPPSLCATEPGICQVPRRAPSVLTPLQQHHSGAAEPRSDTGQRGI